ncbi:hypothetical protein XI09_10190 [Bradyrhizobium sp. CCBAU 11386]|uniref:hypothetical protein n=1 Tax=Bradyrhizobium sp. CCBAU 11386 TaxID=1630837 RepID=UPI0023043E61|nr:hypothetical protein [Bradyrhizobium sp. CCBAU 11386]MDA9505055.1 hypothetical protein [Bradyrhizobium sp. CCBAU 11386]
MFVRLKFAAAALGVICLAGATVPDRASAITAELARTCKALTSKEFPPRKPGNPAAGSSKGSGRDQQAFFDKCIANNGKVDDGSK